jgi:GntR family transcriptional repressor for pyruvate dehydrogenase complex
MARGPLIRFRHMEVFQTSITKRTPAFRAVADDLLFRIKTGEFPLASTLPSEIDLAAQYGVSRSTVREALRIVSARGLLVTRRGSHGGSIVVSTGHNEEHIPTPTADFGADVLDSTEIVATRALFDVPSARAAARRRTRPDVEMLRQTVESPTAAMSRTDTFDFHWRFHAVLYRICGSPLISAVAYPLVSFAHEHTFMHFSEESAAQSLMDHQHILAAIEDGDADRAGQHMVEHLRRLAILHAAPAPFSQPAAYRE